MEKFSNQYNFRVDNQIKVINALRKGQRSLNFLAEKLNISFTAISKIVNQLISYDVLKRVNKKPSNSKRGRIPVLVKLNTSVGLTCAIDLSSAALVVTINDLNGNSIASKMLNQSYFVREDTLELLAKSIRELLNEPVCEKRKLLGICIACPGMITKDKGEVYNSFRLKEISNISLNNYFFNIFGVPVDVYSDTKIASVAEKIYGDIPQEAQNYCLAHIGSAAGAALIIGGKIYQGKHGFSGEFSNICGDDNENLYEKNRLFGMWEIAQMLEEKDKTVSIKKDDFTVDFKRAEALYEERNPAFIETIKLCAKQNAVQIIAYNDFLDLEYFVIEGSILKFIDVFKENLLKYINSYSNGNFKAKIIFSSLGGTAALNGTIYQSTNLYFLRTLEKITNDRCSNGTYDISESFSDEI